ncbi:hypothetical protein ACQI4E_32430 [Streptomyces sp. CA-252508]|uniref:hypothetical protein n=1 Tax=Streptomyces sp. CA-252508 TaxID=3418946 RepID=UPI003D8E3A4B
MPQEESGDQQRMELLKKLSGIDTNKLRELSFETEESDDTARFKDRFKDRFRDRQV